MTRDEQISLDVWAVTHLRLTKNDIDRALHIAGLDRFTCSLRAARAACIEYSRAKKQQSR